MEEFNKALALEADKLVHSTQKKFGELPENMHLFDKDLKFDRKTHKGSVRDKKNESLKTECGMMQRRNRPFSRSLRVGRSRTTLRKLSSHTGASLIFSLAVLIGASVSL